MLETIETQELICKSCKYKVNENDVFCPECGYPLKGTQEEQGKFIGQRILNKKDKEDSKKKIKNAKITLFVIAGLTFIYGLILFFTQSDSILFISNTIISGIYLGLGFWASKKPFAALLTALFIYLSLLIINAFIDPITIFHGVIWKILIISYLIKGLYSAWEIKNNL